MPWHGLPRSTISVCPTCRMGLPARGGREAPIMVLFDRTSL
jgi:hypothetical protein